MLLYNRPRYGLPHRAALCVMDTWRKYIWGGWRWCRSRAVLHSNFFILCMIYWWIHGSAWTEWISGQHVSRCGFTSIQEPFWCKCHLVCETSDLTMMSSDLRGAKNVPKQLHVHHNFLKFPEDHKSPLGQSTKALCVNTTSRVNDPSNQHLWTMLERLSKLEVLDATCERWW